MKITTLFWAIAVLAIACKCVVIEPSISHKAHYEALGPVSGDKIINITFALTHDDSVTSRLEAELGARSDPSSPVFGQWLDDAGLKEIVHDAKGIKAVSRWVRSVAPDAMVSVAAHGDAVHVRAPVYAVNALLSTELVRYAPIEGTGERWAASSYTLPPHVASHVSTIAGLHHLPPVKPSVVSTPISDATGPAITTWNAGAGRALISVRLVCKSGGYVPYSAHETLGVMCDDKMAIDGVTYNLKPAAIAPKDRVKQVEITGMATTADLTCWKAVVNKKAITECWVPVSVPLIDYVRYTPVLSVMYMDGSSSGPSTTTIEGPLVSSPWTMPHTIKQAYSVPAGYKVTTKADQAIVGFFGQFFNQPALTDFLAWNGLADNTIEIIGNVDQTSPGGEASLDVQYITGIGTGARTAFYSIDATYEANEDFLSWLLQLAADKTRPTVHSISYEDEEGLMDAKWRSRVNTEFAKLSLLGLTFVGGSGDDGAANFGIRTDAAASCATFQPGFPCSSPYVLCVSATQLDMDDRPAFHRARGLPFLPGHGLPGTPGDVEVGCSSDRGARITTGGGFSGAFKRPEYQKGEVKAYLGRTNALPTIGRWNQAGRGYPDISTFGHNYLINMPSTPQGPATDFDLMVVDGTSASTPVMAGLVTLLNDARARAGLGTMGFINPWLYNTARVHPECFVDIVTGNNRCGSMGVTCCDQGFSATPGWDAVTGLGTPVWTCLRDVATGRPSSSTDVQFPILWRMTFACTLLAVIGLLACNMVIAIRLYFVGRKANKPNNPVGHPPALDPLDEPLLN